MATVTATITTVEKPAAATAFGEFRFLLRQSNPSQTVIQDATSASTTFQFPDNVPDGTYYVEVQDLDVYGAQLGSSVLSAAFLIGPGTPPGEPVPYQGVASVTVVVS